jgi:NADH:ubiquinone oxidoreductase subunit 5 (subunit L)/multisubunit Na+/H+ antiporter MnhA subunit
VTAILQLVASILALLGIALAYVRFRREKPRSAELVDPSGYRGVRRALYAGLGFDALYRTVFVWSWNGLADLLKRDWISVFFDGVAAMNRAAHRLLEATQSRLIRWYAAGIAFGIFVLLALVVFL